MNTLKNTIKRMIDSLLGAKDLDNKMSNNGLFKIEYEESPPIPRKNVIYIKDDPMKYILREDFE
jgi:hypothetical protein